jgi:ribosome-interacting GTPase 1
VRIYTKVPGHPPERSRPFALQRGDTVQEVARRVRRGTAGEVRSARIWGSSAFPGQQVARDHVLADGDVVELHW